MDTLWNQETAFPMIASSIDSLCHGPEHFVTREEIVRFLLREPSVRKMIDAAYRKTTKKKSIQKYAGNMVDWFSQRWTVGHEKWFSLFKRFERSEKKIDHCWAYKPLVPTAVLIFADEVEDDSEKLPEGAVHQRLVNAFERNLLARQRYINKYGSKCYVCGFSFGATYGSVVDGFIHVHHLRQLSTVGKKYEIDPIADLRPVCPNCHAVIHSRPGQPYSIEEVQSFLHK